MTHSDVSPSSLADTIDQIGTAFSEFKRAQDARLDHLETRISRPGAFTGSPSDATRAENRKLGSALRQAMRGSDAELKGMQVGQDDQGGFLVVPQLENRILAIREAISPLSNVARTIPVDAGSAVELPIVRGNLPGSWVAEQAARPETATLPVTMARIELNECYAMPSVTQRLLDDSNYDVGSLIVDQIGHGLALVEDIALYSGDGIGKPRGFLTYTTAATADATRAWGTTEHVNTGANGAFHTTGADVLFDAVERLHSRYRAGARWMMNRTTFAAVRKLRAVTDGQYLLQASVANGPPNTLLGFEVVISEQMPVHTTTGALAIAFGDFAQAVTIVRRPGVKLIRDPFSQKGSVAFYAYQRVGAGVVDFNAIKLVRFSA